MKMVRTAPIETGTRELMRIEETFQFKRDIKDEDIWAVEKLLLQAVKKLEQFISNYPLAE